MGALPAEGEACECDQGIDSVEAERASCDESDLGVEGLDECVGEPVFDGRDDRGSIGADALSESNEGRQS